MPRCPHSQPGTLCPVSPLTARPQLAVIAVHRRHGRTVSRFRANQPETGAGAEIGASLKANQLLRRLRTSPGRPLTYRAPPRPTPGLPADSPLALCVDPLGKSSNAGEVEEGRKKKRSGAGEQSGASLRRRTHAAEKRLDA